MNHQDHLQNTVLAIYPSSRGYAYVLFEDAQNLYDWGVKDIRKKNKNEAALEGISTLIERYLPGYIVIEDYTEKGSSRSTRIRRLYRMISNIALKEGIEIKRIPREAIFECFASDDVKKKSDITRAIARELPELAHRLPPVRKIWMSEDPRQGLFDAAALGVTFYAVHSAQ